MNEQDTSAKKRYLAPTLAVHGKLAELTAGGASGATENQIPNPRRIQPV